MISTESNSIQKTDIKKEEEDETKTLIDRYNTSEDRLTGSEELVRIQFSALPVSVN